jgi:glycosyltransferase involved in cell wall biosynthesis
VTAGLRITQFGEARLVARDAPAAVDDLRCVPSETDVRGVVSDARGGTLRGCAVFARAVGLLVLRRRRATGVAHVHVSHARAFVRAGVLVVLARLRRVPVVATVHEGVQPGRARWRRWFVRATLRRAGHVSVRRAEDARRLASLGVGGAEVVPPPDGEGDGVPAGPRDPVVVLAGALSRRKGVDVLLEAWPRVRSVVPEARLLLLGPRYDVVPERKAPGLPGVEPLGAQPQAVVARTLARARVAVLPSRNEGLPAFLVEAMAAGCGVVATPVGGVPGLLAPESAGQVPGVLVPVGDADALADALILALDADVAAARGAVARRRAREGGAGGSAGSRMEQIWQSVAVDVGRPRRRAASRR